ncbi:MAG: DUF2470 domain-containing protein [Polyangiaceae bacterium]
MTDSSPVQNAVAAQNAVSARAPSHAERCRTLVAAASSAALSTIAVAPEAQGHPYGSLVAFASDELGRPILLLSKLAEHTTNLAAHASSSVLVTEVGPPGADPLALGRVTLLGETRRLDAAEAVAARAIFLVRVPGAAAYVGFADFAFYRLEPITLRFVGGFGRMSWVTADAYRSAEADPIAPAAAGILSHMNEDHADATLAYATKLARIEGAVSANMIAVDRYGFEVEASTPEGARRARVPFDAPVSSADEVRRSMIALLRRLRGA